MLQQQNRTAIYCRLSREDGDGESMSIGNQREMLVRYCKDNGLLVVDIYIDDGFSGTDFERPDFLRMIRDMLNELIDKIVVHEGDKSTGKRTQKIDIYYRFIGLIG